MFRQKYFTVLSFPKKLIEHLPYPKVNYLKSLICLYEIPYSNLSMNHIPVTSIQDFKDEQGIVLFFRCRKVRKKRESENDYFR